METSLNASPGQQPSPTQKGRPPRFTAALLFVFALTLTVGGAQLILLSGSLYFAVTGLWLILTAVLLWRGSVVGIWLYLVMLIGTVIWTISEIGLTFWAMVPRLLLPGVFGVWILMPCVRRGLH